MRTRKVPRGARHLRTYAEFHSYLVDFVNGHYPFLWVVGRPGLAKTESIRAAVRGRAVYYRKADKQAAQDVATILGSAHTFPINPTYAAYAPKGLVVVLGKSFTGQLAKPAPNSRASGGLPADERRLDENASLTGERRPGRPCHFLVRIPA